MKILKIILNTLIISFLLNFSWEFLQSPFYDCFDESLRSNYYHYILAILGDSIYTIIIYFIISILNKDLFWIKNSWNRKNVINLIFIWFLLALFIEYKWVFILQKWSYSNLMPTVYWIWIIPILQMMILPLMTFKIVKNLNSHQ